jgi:hypothetical protein
MWMSRGKFASHPQICPVFVDERKNSFKINFSNEGNEFKKHPIHS